MSASAVAIPDWQQPVLRLPLNQAFPELGGIAEFRNKVCLFNADRTRCFDVVSPRYQIVEHGEAIQRIISTLNTYFGTSNHEASVRTFGNGARMSAIIELPVLKPVVVAKGDISKLRLSVRNSYDRSCIFRAELSALRLVCTNGMTMAERYGSIRMKHLAGNQDDEEDREEANAALMADLDAMVTGAPKLQEKWKEWADTKITRLQAVDMIEEAFPRMYTDPILDEARWDVERTMWQFYNDLTHMSTHLTQSVQRRMTFDDTIAKLFYTDEDASAGEDGEGDD